MRAHRDRLRSDVGVGRGGAYYAWQSACASGGRWICAQVCWYAYETKYTAGQLLTASSRPVVFFCQQLTRRFRTGARAIPPLQNLRLPKEQETLGSGSMCAAPTATPTLALRPVRLPLLPHLLRPLSCTPPQAGPFALFAAGDRRDQGQACAPPRVDECQGAAAAARRGAGRRHRAHHPGGWRAVHGRRA
eukprot:scaffold130143_cov45-Phaeocystis_antarctica.AAC.1